MEEQDVNRPTATEQHATKPTDPAPRPVLDRTAAAEWRAWRAGDTMTERERDYYMRKGATT
jgi:hypothetical protein